MWSKNVYVFCAFQDWRMQKTGVVGTKTKEGFHERSLSKSVFAIVPPKDHADDS